MTGGDDGEVDIIAAAARILNVDAATQDQVLLGQVEVVVIITARIDDVELVSRVIRQRGDGHIIVTLAQLEGRDVGKRPDTRTVRVIGVLLADEK